MMFDDKREVYNVDNDPLYANANVAEGTADNLDILSNGFDNIFNYIFPFCNKQRQYKIIRT